MHFTFCPSETLETLYCGTTPGSQFQVCPHLSTIVAGLRRSRRLQYVKKSVNNPSTFAGECTPASPPYLVNQVRSGVHCRICSWICCLFTSGAAPGSAAGSAAGSSERISMFGATADLKTIRTVGGLQDYIDVRNQQRTEQKNNQLLSHQLSHVPSTKRKERVPNCGGLPTSTTTVKNANHTVGTHRSMLKPSPPWLHCYGLHPGRAMAC